MLDITLQRTGVSPILPAIMRAGMGLMFPRSRQPCKSRKLQTFHLKLPGQRGASRSGVLAW